jgi:Polysaccharide lyase
VVWVPGIEASIEADGRSHRSCRPTAAGSDNARVRIIVLLLLLAAVVLASCDEADERIKVEGSQLVLTDPSLKLNPDPIWGGTLCEDDSRVTSQASGGDNHPRGDGVALGDTAFRRMTVIDGDDNFGERCELGDNDRDGPTALYREGKRRVTFVSVRLPTGFPLKEDVFQVVMQMKQAQPSDGGGGTPVLALEAFDDRWRLRQSDSVTPSNDAHELWSAPAQIGSWTRFAFDITYSQDPSIGRITVYADLNGDLDFDDADELSETLETYTLKVETADGDDGLAEGESIPSHLRTGLYHSPEYSCPPPSGCSVDVDNVQVFAP